MSMTMTQKILASHAGLDSVEPGRLIEINLDLVMGNDITAPLGIKEFNKIGVDNVFDTDKVALVPDHFVPNKDIKAAEQAKVTRDFANAQKIKNYFEVGEMGIEHVILPEKGIVTAGDAVIGADSHTCTYGALGAFSTGVGSTDFGAAMATGTTWLKVPSAIKFELSGKPGKYISGKDVILHIIGKIGVDGALYKSMEFCGDGVKHLNMDDRLTICNMAIEAGAKNGIFPVDDITKEYIKTHGNRDYKVYTADDDAYEEIVEIDLSQIKPTVAFPHLPENARTPDNWGKVEIDQVVIGSCTNGRFSDMKAAAEILSGKKVKEGMRVIVIPGSQKVYMDCLDAGYLKIFIQSGCIVSTPTCGPCLGGYMGILAAGERALSTTNRNFVGRMGHTESEVYLCSPAVAAASALTGVITDPNALLRGDT